MQVHALILIHLHVTLKNIQKTTELIIYVRNLNHFQIYGLLKQFKNGDFVFYLLSFGLIDFKIILKCYLINLGVFIYNQWKLTIKLLLFNIYISSERVIKGLCGLSIFNTLSLLPF